MTGLKNSFSGGYRMIWISRWIKPIEMQINNFGLCEHDMDIKCRFPWKPRSFFRITSYGTPFLYFADKFPLGEEALSTIRSIWSWNSCFWKVFLQIGCPKKEKSWKKAVWSEKDPVFDPGKQENQAQKSLSDNVGAFFWPQKSDFYGSKGQ